ncbi:MULTISPECIES: hypothetical protein [Burkholderia]|uniref:Uncharacterized protein n=1 Tax=Burkholderia paludis TaxID=1506587 RepID=A0A6P2MVL2_9BURK|nr:MULTISPECIES: hypothetical protein [Burkholderia]CAB3760729.1 hypothetical protein LMG30113_03745 [Burkholderia paludis]VWB87741.1 hypothetical protein BPA30113_04063 [Burkholderia paludis]
MAAPRQRPEAARRSEHPDGRCRKLAGFREATSLTFREATIQARIADSTRGSPAFVNRKDLKSAVTVLNDVYRAPMDRYSRSEGDARSRHRGKTPFQHNAHLLPSCDGRLI